MMKDLLNELSEKYDITVLYAKRTQTPENFQELFNPKIRFIEVKNFTREINFVKDWKALQEIRKIIKKEKPDIIHLHSSKAGVIGRIAASGRKYTMLYNPHGFAFLKEDDSKVKRKIYKMIEKVIAKWNKKCTIIGCSQGEFDAAKQINPNSVCINNGINTDSLLLNQNESMQKNFENNSKLRVCTVGRIDYQKNPEAFNRIAEGLPDIDFTWIGDGELKEKLTAPNIKTTGWIDRDNTLKELSKNDIFILFSLWEGLPISLLEAMALKKICIVSDVIGNRDVITNQKNGYICKEVEECITLLKELLEGKQDRYLENIKEQAFKDITEKYSISQMSKQYIRVYEGIR